MSLFKVFIYSWFNFGRLCMSRISFISFRFSSLLKYRFLKYVDIILWFLFMSVFSPFSSNFINLYHLFFLLNLTKSLLILLFFLKESTLGLINSLHFSCFYFIDFNPKFVYFFLSTYLLFWVLVLLVFLDPLSLL